jgi:3-oxoacyl-[acyl-carrier-protein] synthase-3
MARAGLEGTPGFDINSGGCPGGVFALDAGAVGIDLFAVHQANLRLVYAVLDGLQQPFTKTVTNISRIGNTAGASIPLVLGEAPDSGRPSHLALLVAFGGGFNYGTTLIRWCGPADFAPWP